MSKHKFPLLAVLLLVFGATWLAQDLGYLNVNIPWIPVILIAVAISMIWNRVKD